MLIHRANCYPSSIIGRCDKEQLHSLLHTRFVSVHELILGIVRLELELESRSRFTTCCSSTQRLVLATI